MVLVAIVLVSLVTNILIHKEFEKYAKEQQKTRIADIVANLVHHYNYPDQKWDFEFVHGVGMLALYDGYIIRLLDPDDNVIFDAEKQDTRACAQVEKDITERMEKKRPGLKGSFVSHEQELKWNNQKIGRIVIQHYGPYFLSEGDFRFLDSLNILLVALGILALLCSLTAAGFLARRISRPVIKTAYIATQIAEGNYKIRFDGDIRTRELGELVSAVNHMAVSLDNQEQMRRRLTNDIAHELRTPLAAVASHLETMIEGVWDPTLERLQSCYEEIERITGLVSALEQQARLESDNLRLEKTSVDLLELAHTVAGNFESESFKKKVAVFVSGEETRINADRDKLNQVLANLLSNAIKFTPENGQVRITVSDTHHTALITVEDNGIGIPKGELPLIFDRFYRTDKSRNRLTGGTGIGLTIARSIVSAHKGTIEAESEAEYGSRFTVTLPKA